jgi:hypothetical protein
MKKPPISERLPAVRTGLEPATSAVTGRHSNQLNYRTFLLDSGAKINLIFNPANRKAQFFYFF